MDPGEELDLSKENIQPLKKGRMVGQLGTALLAQADLEAHHELLKKREKYEVLIRTYEGSDPLEIWYEYILWVEQSFLRDGREGKLSVLLERCLIQFKEDERYLQDRRYIELWIKYIEMSLNPLEVYKKCHAHDIGKYCAFFYMTWAFELEKDGDIKRANQVFSEGFKNSAQPWEELEEAHKNFQLRVARQFLSGQSEVETVCTEQRMVLKKLKAHGRKKNLVGSVRVGGENVQRGSAGILQPITQNSHRSSNVQAGSFEFFNDEENGIGHEFAVSGAAHLLSIPRREIINKENLLEPGPWTGKPRKTRAVAATVSRPQRPPFELHQDEDVEVQNCPLVIYNALKPRKLDDDQFKCAIAMFEPEDTSKCPMYCKNKVYAGGTEFSFEELRAIEYLKGNIATRRKEVGNLPNEACDQVDELACDQVDELACDQEDERSCPVAVFESPDPTKRPMYCKNKVYVRGTEFSFEELRAVEYLKVCRPTQCRQAYSIEYEADTEATVSKLYGEELHKIKLFEDTDCKTKNTSLPVAQETRNIPAPPFNLYVDDEGEDEASFRRAPVLDTETAGLACPDLSVGKHGNWLEDDDDDDISAALSNTLPKPFHMKPSSITDSSSDNAKSLIESCDQSSLCCQSLTYHTKEAMNIMQDFWTTPEDKKMQSNMQEIGHFGPKKNIFPCENIVDGMCLVPEQPKMNTIPFEIFKDESEVQKQGSNDIFCAPQPESKVSNFEIFKDETEVLVPMQNCPGNLVQPAEHKSHIRQIFGEKIILHKGIGNKRISEPTKDAKENCILSSNAPDSNSDQPWCPRIQTCNSEDAVNSQSVPCKQLKIIVDAPVSPDMTEEEEEALRGTELKENDPPQGTLPAQTENRIMAGILQPSPDFPCDPQDDPALQEEVPDSEAYYSNVTCNTQAFSYPLLSSTPFVSQFKQMHGKNGAEASAKTGRSQSAEVSDCAQGSAGSALRTVESLSTIMETTEHCRSSGSSSSSGATTRHTTMFSQENCMTGNKKRSENIHDRMRHSLQDRYITKALLENGNIQEVHRQSDLCSNDFIVNRMSESLCHQKMKTMHYSNAMDQVHPPEWPNPPQNTYTEESVKTVLRKERSLNEEQEGIQIYQQISGFVKNSTGLGQRFQCNKTSFKDKEENLFQAKDNAAEHTREDENDTGGAYNDKSSRTQGNDLAIDFSKLQLGAKGIDPFDHTLIQQLLTHVEFPKAEISDQYVKMDMQVPRFKIGGMITLGKDKFTIEKILGEGSYAKVFKATDSKTQRTVALKVQKPSWEWEFYICHQLQSRLSDPVSALAFMDISTSYILNNGSIMVTEYSHYGSLLSIIIKLKERRFPIPDNLSLRWMTELLSIAEKLQQCHIVHGDIKPDNFILKSLPSLESKEPSLQLIDMGRGIDMSLFPEGTVFNTVVTTKDFQCIEMQTKQPWTYQTDLYGIAGTMHCVHFGQYMKVRKQRDGRWFIQQSVSRSSKRHVWEQFFYTLLNVESCEKLPDLPQLRSFIDTTDFSDVCVSNLRIIRKILEDNPKK